LFSLRSFVSALAIVVGLTVLQFQFAPAAKAAATESGEVLSFAAHQINKPFRLGANGLHRYDCSGLVYRAFLEAHLAKRIGGERTARGYYNWFKRHGKITKNPRRGDLVVWAKPGRRVSHIGIFYGYNRRGRPLAISALVNPWGVTKHKVNSIHLPLKAYLHVDLRR